MSQQKTDFIIKARRAAYTHTHSNDGLSEVIREYLAMKYKTGQANAIVADDITEMNASNTGYPAITLAQWDAFMADVETILAAFNTADPATPKQDTKFFPVRVL